MTGRLQVFTKHKPACLHNGIPYNDVLEVYRVNVAWEFMV